MPKSSEITLRLLQLLAFKPRSLQELESMLSMTQRNIRFHINSVNKGLSDDRLIIDKHRRKYRLNGGELIEAIFGDTTLESATLALAPSILKPAFPGSLLQGCNVNDIEKKIRQFVDIRQGSGEDDGLRITLAALKSNRSISFLYASAGTPTRRKALPIRLFLDPVATYLVAYDSDYSRLVTYAMSKIQDPVISSVEPPRLSEATGYRSYLDRAWGKMLSHDKESISTARFEVHPSIAPYFLRRPLHASQTLDLRPERWSIVELKVHNPLEICRYLLRFGRGVKIIGDEAVLTEMRSFLDSMQSWYSRREKE